MCVKNTLCVRESVQCVQEREEGYVCVSVCVCKREFVCVIILESKSEGVCASD